MGRAAGEARRARGLDAFRTQLLTPFLGRLTDIAKEGEGRRLFLLETAVRPKP
ncbi:MAG: hypothetical protein RMI90_00010 [Thermoguttaceae bacterium]|nr:hypothetical protein [Thermoguttaceae bacterium]